MRTQSRGRARAGQRPAVPPPDNPLLRFRALNVDRRLPDAELVVRLPAAATRESARGAARGGRARRARIGRALATASDGETTLGQLAALRLAALEEHRTRMAAAPEAVARAATAGPRAPSPELTRAAKGVAGPAPVPPTPGVSNWVQMGPTCIPKGQTYGGPRVNVTGRVTAIVVDPTNSNVIYIGTALGGVWKTVDGGLNWVPTTDNAVSLAIGALAIDPSNPLVLYAGTGEGNFSLDSYYGNGVLASTDGGSSWTTQGQTTFTGASFGRLAVTPGTPARLFAATGIGLYRSTNSGANWTKMTGVPAWSATDVVIDPTTPTTVYAAFWGSGIYRTTNAGAATPTWTQLAGGLSTTGFTRIALGISPSSPQTVYALMSGPSTTNPSTSYLVNQFLRTTDGGNTWTSIALTGGDIGTQGFYNLNVAVDPTTPDIVYLSGISLWKATRDPVAGTWTINDIGGAIHPDNHAFAFDPANHLVIYAGTDGGVYRSTDGGTTWNDTINEGPCITQFEFIDHHPTSDAVVVGGTQDNGTEQYRNTPVFHHADDGDGGYCAVDQNQPRNVISTYYSASPKRSTAGGEFGTWTDVSGGLVGGSALFYPPLALDQTNPANIAFGTDQVNLDGAQGTGGWPTQVTLPGMSGNVSALHYVNSNLIYAGTDGGLVYRLTRTGTTWTAAAIHAAPLPSQWIWDVIARPDDANTVIVVMSGFGISHVWRGVVPAGGGVATWTNISGSGAGTLPDIPTNALAIDPSAPDTYYIATDIAVYRTTNGGTTWTQFSDGLPNCAVFDLRLHNPTRLLRAATHGRGLWERRLDGAVTPAADLYVRDDVMDTGRRTPSASGVAAAFADPLQHVALGDQVWWWQCADVKVDAQEGVPPSYQLPVSAVDYVAFETKLEHRNPQRGRVNRVYVQLHNRGYAPALGVTVKLLYANASAGLPPLPADFWTVFPGDSTSSSSWTPIGAAQVVPSVSPAEPVVLEWDWTPPTSAADHSCILVVMDSASDPISAASKTTDVNVLVPNEKRVGLKNLHVVNAPPRAPYWTPLEFFGPVGRARAIRILPSRLGGWKVGLILPKTARGVSATGFAERRLTAAELKALRQRFGDEVARLDPGTLYVVESAERGGRLSGVSIPSRGLRVALVLQPPASAGREGSFTIVQESDGKVIGGNTFVLRTTRGRVTAG